MRYSNRHRELYMLKDSNFPFFFHSHIRGSKIHLNLGLLFLLGQEKIPLFLKGLSIQSLFLMVAIWESCQLKNWPFIFFSAWVICHHVLLLHNSGTVLSSESSREIAALSTS